MDSDDKMIVFVDRKSTLVILDQHEYLRLHFPSRADAISSELIRKHVICQSIHGDR